MFKTKILLFLLFGLLSFELDAQSIFDSMTYKALPPTQAIPITPMPSLPPLEDKLKGEYYQRKSIELYEKRLENEARALKLQEQNISNKRVNNKELYEIQSFRTVTKSNGDFISSSMSHNSTLEIVDNKYVKLDIPKLDLKDVFIIEEELVVDDLPVYKLSGSEDYIFILDSDNEKVLLGLVLDGLTHNYILTLLL
ncbi:hypothetical protein [Sphingobacterium deserti]|uniref:Uncharacterized protein n=1 Tax=Sphingobacterium deserti TaxID=1229276 RepID=A0A0B8T416_9SPHI|nr:hypothetical protein [Sphingobacterium deserti]KGE16076.1 hypothetical protein DI53_0191 [Sphingobacterium deserti]